MNFVNSVVVEGNVVRDPVVKTTERGTAGCFFSIATDRQYTKGTEPVRETSFFAIETWGALATECSTSCTHGKFVRVVGRLRQDRWVDPDGKTRTKIKIIAEHVVFRSSAKRMLAASETDEVQQNDEMPVFTADPEEQYDSEKLAEVVAF